MDISPSPPVINTGKDIYPGLTEEHEKRQVDFIMSNKCVTVLAPNGRRQNVKVTPNTTILQVLEEVCKKQGFKAEEYDITHHNKVLGATSIIRYTGLPNNAQLEMAAALKARAESSVKVGLALENGNRVMGQFEPSDSLWHVVRTLCPDEAEDDFPVLPVIFYLGREESGVENLKKTSLRNLGLTSGGAILRFFKKTAEELHHQANVSAPLSRPTMESLVKPSTSAGVLPGISTMGPSTSISKTSQSSYLDMGEVKSTENPPSFQQDFGHAEEMIPSSTEGMNEIMPSVTSSTEKELPQNEVIEMDYEDSTESTTQTSSAQSFSESTRTEEAAPNEEPEETIVFLGERNAVLFDVATARACRTEDVPDDFFDLTLDDAKQLLRDMKRRQAAMEEQPLVTSQYRELEKSKQMLNTLSQYKRCVIKVQFPNQLVLQGTFTPLEKVSHVMDFVKGYLQDPSINFCIFTTPPKNILLAEQTLYDANCVPGALVHLSADAPCPENGSYIREDIMARVSTASAAATAASRATTHRTKNISSATNSGTEPQHMSKKLPHSSTSAPCVPKSSVNPEKVPKWFQTKK